MIWLTIAVAPVIVISAIGEAMEYTSNGILREKLVLYHNPRFGLETIGSGDDQVLYMTITDTIMEEDELRLSTVAERSDGVEFPIPSNPIELCKLLADEAENVDSPLTQFRVSRVFNMAGRTCPIPAGKRRLMPYMFPPRLSLSNDIGCGTFTYKTTIESCQGQKPENCTPYITASTDVFLSGDHCSNTLM